MVPDTTRGIQGTAGDVGRSALALHFFILFSTVCLDGIDYVGKELHVDSIVVVQWDLAPF